MPWLLIVALQVLAIRKPAATALDLTGAGVATLYALFIAWTFDLGDWTCDMGDSEGGLIGAALWLIIIVPFCLLYLQKGWAIHFGKGY